MYKVLILAGGLGTRLSEETELKPKPMVEIGDQPILLHIMQIFAKQVEVEFIIATGYRSEVIEEYLESSAFLETALKARAVFTGDQTGTAGRVRKVLEMFPNEKFFITYGDGLANVNIKRLLDFHENHGRTATVTAVRPANGEVFHFAEKMQSDEGWINGGFFFVEPRLIKYLKSDSEMLEQ